MSEALSHCNDPWRLRARKLKEGDARILREYGRLDTIGPCGPSGTAEFIGNDGLVTLGCEFSIDKRGALQPPDVPFRDTVGSTKEQSGTFMHELGHNLGLRHGGETTTNGIPNYPSIMSYSRQTEEHFSSPSEHILDFSKGEFDSTRGTPISLMEAGGLDETIGLSAAGRAAG